MLSLEQVATLVEFADEPGLLADLTAIAAEDPAYLPVAMQWARNDRATATANRDTETAEAARAPDPQRRPGDWCRRRPGPSSGAGRTH